MSLKNEWNDRIEAWKNDIECWTYEPLGFVNWAYHHPTLARSARVPDAHADLGRQEFTYSFYAWEWCSDEFNGGKYRVRKGGSWDFDAPTAFRIDFRGFDRPEVRDVTIGFRLMLSRK